MLVDRMHDGLTRGARGNEASGRYARAHRLSFAPETRILGLKDTAPLGEGHAISFLTDHDIRLWPIGVAADDPRRDTTDA